MLEVLRLGAGYKGIAIISECSLSVDRGEIVGIQGRNGTGKSTLLKAIAGELPRLAGKVTVDDDEASPHIEDMLRLHRVAYLPQDGRNIPNLTVTENYFLATGRSWPSGSKAGPFLKRLEPCRRRMAANISGGQSLALSLAIVLNLYQGVAYLILDEPSAGADKNQLEDIEQMIKTAAEDSCGVLMVEQDINLLRRLADRIYECRDGTLQKSETLNSALTKII